LVGVVGGVLSLLEKLPDEESDELDMDDDEADDDAICACSARRSLDSIGAPDSSVLMMLCVRVRSCVCVCGRACAVSACLMKREHAANTFRSVPESRPPACDPPLSLVVAAPATNVSAAKKNEARKQ
jgi:hypothetical protein